MSPKFLRPKSPFVQGVYLRVSQVKVYALEIDDQQLSARVTPSEVRECLSNSSKVGGDPAWVVIVLLILTLDVRLGTGVLVAM